MIGRVGTLVLTACAALSLFTPEHASAGDETAPARQAAPRALHRYRASERLRMGNGGNLVSRAASYCTVVALLPYEGHGARRYRVRSEAEAFERVVAEGDLSRD